jgi:lauroyl/myristoyl acyltransferase
MWTRLSVHAAFYVYPHRRRSAEPLLTAVRTCTKSGAIKIQHLAKRYLVYRQWFNDLIYAWPNWAGRCDQWAFVEGEHHLKEALSGGRGAILLSGHQFGYERYAAAVLAQKGYRVSRTGSGVDPVRRVARWGKGTFKNWDYLNYHGDYWHRVQMMRQLHYRLKENGIVLMSIMAFPQGSPEFAVEYFYGRFYLDSNLVRLIESAGSPVLPCFAICDDDGSLRIKVEPGVKPQRREIIEEFGQVYAGYLGRFPEFARIWKRVIAQESEW